MISAVNTVFNNSNIYMKLNIHCIERYLIPEYLNGSTYKTLATYKVRNNNIFRGSFCTLGIMQG